MDGEDWKNKCRPFNGNCTQISSVQHIPHVVIADCIIDLLYSWKDVHKHNILQQVSHTTIPKPMPPTVVFMTSKAVRLWKAQDITCTFDQSPDDEDRTVSLTASLRLNWRAMRFLYAGRWLDTAKITAQVHHVDHNFAIGRGAWRQLVKLCKPVWKNQQASRVSNSNFDHEGSRGSLEHQLS